MLRIVYAVLREVSIDTNTNELPLVFFFFLPSSNEPLLASKAAAFTAEK